jgi:sortase A
MKRKLGLLLMVLGLVFLFGAVGLLIFNQQEGERAASASAELMPKINAAIVESGNEKPSLSQSHEQLPGVTEPEHPEMKSVEIDGHSYIGYLSIPKLNLELPVMSDWSMENLKIAPARFYGTTMEGNLVLVAHNYKKHFGPIRRLKNGDEVFFVDMENKVTFYQVVATDAVAPSAVEEVTAGAYDLALVTCTYGGDARLVVYCDVHEPAK